MFQNESIAKEFGTKVTDEALARGLSPKLAGQQGRYAARVKLEQLDKWTEENVGLN